MQWNTKGCLIIVVLIKFQNGNPNRKKKIKEILVWYRVEGWGVEIIAKFKEFDEIQ